MTWQLPKEFMVTIGREALIRLEVETPLDAIEPGVCETSICIDGKDTVCEMHIISFFEKYVHPAVKKALKSGWHQGKPMKVVGDNQVTLEYKGILCLMTWEHDLTSKKTLIHLTFIKEDLR